MGPSEVNSESPTDVAWRCHNTPNGSQVRPSSLSSFSRPTSFEASDTSRIDGRPLGHRIAALIDRIAGRPLPLILVGTLPCVVSFFTLVVNSCCVPCSVAVSPVCSARTLPSTAPSCTTNTPPSRSTPATHSTHTHAGISRDIRGNQVYVYTFVLREHVMSPRELTCRVLSVLCAARAWQDA